MRDYDRFTHNLSQPGVFPTKLYNYTTPQLCACKIAGTSEGVITGANRNFLRGFGSDQPVSLANSKFPNFNILNQNDRLNLATELRNNRGILEQELNSRNN
jgi:hypothetical protein